MLDVYSCTAVGARKTELILGVNEQFDFYFSVFWSIFKCIGHKIENNFL